jgi:putative ABC transport system permease protein
MTKIQIFNNIKNNSFLAAIKFISFLAGFTTLIVVSEWVGKELSFDKFWNNCDRIYRVALEQYQEKDLQFRIAGNYRGVTDLLLHEFPEIEGRVRLHRDRVTVFAPGIQVQDVNMFYTDTSIFKVLNRKVLACSSSSLFPGLQSVMISESLARRLYGNDNPAGKILKLNEGWTFFVNGVFEDVPQNSHIGFDLLMTMPSLNYYISNFNNSTGKLEENAKFEYNEPGPYDSRSWSKYFGYSYILVKKGTPVEELQKKAEALMTPENIPSLKPGTLIRLIFQPVTGIHLSSGLDEEFKTGGSKLKVYSMIVVALVVMLICVVNSVNISVIEFFNNVSGTAIRLIHGADSLQLLKSLFLREFVIILSACLSSYGLASIILQLMDLDPVHGSFTMAISIFLTILIPFLAIIFPAYQMRTRSVFDLLKKRVIKSDRGKKLRLILIFIQFSISLFLIAVTLAIFSQLHYLQEKDTGFIPGSVIFSYSPMTMNQRPDFNAKLQAFRDKMKDIPGVQNFCTSSSIPGRDFLLHSENISATDQDPDRKTFYQLLNVDYSYLETLGLTLAAGRNFLCDDKFPGEEVLINELAARKLGFRTSSEAPGKPLKADGKSYIICGVVRDFNHLSLKQALSPVIIFKSISWPYAVGYYSFKITGADFQNTISLIDKAWTNTYPGEKFLFRSLEANYNEQYQDEQNFSRSVTLGSILAILISCLGLLGYARYNAVKSIREIGIRKAFGAGRKDILIHFNSEILRVIAISAIVILPPAWILVSEWLDNFAYRINLSVWIFILALVITFVIAISTTFFISLRSSILPPSKALAQEQ